MANTYGVSYGSAKQPRSYGVKGSLAGLVANQSMQPLSASKPQGFTSLPASSFQSISDTLNSIQVANKNRLASLVAPVAQDPSLRNDPASPGTQGVTSNTGTGTTATAPPAPAPAGFDETADPILAQIKAAGQRGVQNAASGALAGAQNDLINYGSAQVPQSLRDLFAAQSPTTDPLLGDLPANSILGALNDPNTASAAAANPFSTLAQLGQGHQKNVSGIDQATNANNLFYSSTHANQLGDENTNYLGAQNTAAQNLASLLSGENTGVLNAEDSAHQQYLNELPNAYQRFIAAGDTGAPVPPPGDGTPPPPPGDGTTTANAPAGGLYGAPAQGPSLAALLAASKALGGPSAASKQSRFYN